MQQELWHDTIFDALGSTVQAAGGTSKVARKLWPTLDSVSGPARLRACLNVDHAQKLCIEEMLLIAKLGKDVGDSSVMGFLARELGYEVKPISPIEAKKIAKKAKKLALLEELRRLEADE
jgi:hypothetical protein